MAKEFCACNSTVRQNWGTVKISNGEIACDFCRLPTKDQIHTPINSSTQEDVKKANEQWEQKRIEEKQRVKAERYSAGNLKEQAVKAAQETETTALLFRNYGVIVQWISGILSTLIFIGYLIAFPGGYKLLAFLFSLLVFAPIWLAGALLRGVSSYARFKALAYLASNQK